MFLNEGSQELAVESPVFGRKPAKFLLGFIRGQDLDAAIGVLDDTA